MSIVKLTRVLPVIILALCFAATPAWAADTTAPTTTATLDGVIGANNWYISTVSINMRATDTESGPASTTYQVDSDPPVTNLFSGGSNSILNPSFEDGSGFTLTSWDKVTSDPSLLYQSNLPSKLGQGSATVRGPSAAYQYWTNVNYAVPVSVGQTYATSVWVMTLGIDSGTGAWMEVWVSDSSGGQSDQKMATSSAIAGTTADWQLLSEDVTIPAGYDHVYLKLGSQANDSGQAFFDGATLSTGTDGITQFSLIQNGIHTLTYHSADNEGNTESTKTISPIKIDTVKPQDWSSLSYNTSGNDHTYTMWVTVRDVTSGINPATAQFRTFDKDGCDCWSAWMNVASVKRVDNGQAAAAGYTGFVTLTTPSYDYGNSAKATMPEVQFQIDDMAATAGISPIYALFGPWIQLTGGDVFSGGDITIPGTTPLGQFSANGIVGTAGTTLTGLTSPQAWITMPYALPQAPLASLDDWIPSYSRIKTQGQPFPGGRLPSWSALYTFNGKYTIDSNTLNAGFQGSVFSAVLVINGDLVINQNFQLNAATNVVFLVSGKVIYSGSVTRSAGAIISGNTISTGSSGSPLIHRGSLAALGGFTLGRDLGRKGNPNNTTTPAERIEFQAGYLANPVLANLLSGGPADFHWQEVE